MEKFIVIERHEQFGNRRAWHGFDNVGLAAEFAEELAEDNFDELVHFDVLPTMHADNPWPIAEHLAMAA